MNEGDLIRKRFTLKKEIGRGSYGDVWLAEKQMGLGGGKVLYALKFLRGKDEKGVDIEKVIEEIANWTNASSHINIISIHDSFIEHGKYVIVSDYADGGSLKDKIFLFEEATKVIEGVLNGLEHLHNLPIIHRDIKPENILLKNGVACITDFGLARDFDKTQSTGLAGSINYFSPEMAKKEIDNEEHARTLLDDLWATAITFYQLITNDLPFRKLGNIAKCKRELLPPNFPTELIDFFDKAFHSNRNERFQSAKEMSEALQKALSPEAKHLAELEQLKLQADLEKADLERKLEEAKSNTNELNRTLAKERAKSQYLAEEKQIIEKKLAIENENLQKLRIELRGAQSFVYIYKNSNSMLREFLESAENQLRQLHIEKQETDKNKVLLTAKIEDKNEVVEQILEKLKDGDKQLLENLRDGKKIVASSLFTKTSNSVTTQTEQNLLEAEKLLNSGNTYFGEGSYDKAIKDYSKAIELKPDYALAYKNRATAYYNNGNSAQAIRDDNKAIEIDPNIRDLQRPNIIKQSVLWDIIFESFLWLAVIGTLIPSYLLAYPIASYTSNLLSHNILELGQTGETISFIIITLIVMLIALIFVIVIFAYLVDFSDLAFVLPITFCGIALVACIYLAYSFFLMPNYFQIASDCAEKKDYNCVIENYTNSIYWYPSYWLTNVNKAYFNRGNAYIDKNNYDQAIKDYTKVIELNPQNADAYNNRGASYINKNNYDQAIKDYQKAIEIDPNVKYAKENLKLAIQAKEKQNSH